MRNIQIKNTRTLFGFNFSSFSTKIGTIKKLFKIVRHWQVSIRFKIYLKKIAVMRLGFFEYGGLVFSTVFKKANWWPARKNAEPAINAIEKYVNSLSYLFRLEKNRRNAAWFFGPSFKKANHWPASNFVRPSRL